MRRGSTCSHSVDSVASDRITNACGVRDGYGEYRVCLAVGFITGRLRSLRG